MDNLVQQQKKELFWTRVFIYYINRLSGFDYKIKPHQNQDSCIDVEGISQSGKYPKLNIQLTWVKETEFNPNKPPTKYLIFSEGDIKEAIKRKTDKAIKRGEDVSNIVLLLQGYMAKPWANDILTDQFCSQYRTNPFKGIYYVVRSSTDKYGKERPENGSVLVIKKASGLPV